MRANPEELRGLARSLRSVKDHVDSDRAALHRASVVFETWRGPAADHTRSTLTPDCLNGLGRVSDDLEGLALALERASDELVDRLARIHTIEAHARAWFRSEPSPPTGESPRWEREWWTYRPGRFPDSGDSEWLDASAYLRARGVTI